MTDKTNKTDQSESREQVESALKNLLQSNSNEETLQKSFAGASLEVPLSQGEIIEKFCSRLEEMNTRYKLGLDTDQQDIFESLQYLNDNFFFDRPLSNEEIQKDAENSLKSGLRKTLFPVIKNVLHIVFERQRGFNAELVKFLNRLTEVVGHQRDFNMDVIKFCERMIDHYRIMEEMERKLDDFFAFTPRISVLEDEIETLKERLSNLEEKSS